MKQYATLQTTIDLHHGTACYTMPWGHGEPQMTNLNGMLATGWEVKTQSIVPGFLSSMGYRETQFIFVLERDAPIPEMETGASNGS